MNNMIVLYKKLYVFIADWFSHFTSSTVIMIVEEQYDGYVYNLSIDRDETYIADGVVVHNCRSTTIPRVKDEYKLAGFEGERPAIGAGGVESVSANKSYGSWLKTQPKEFVDEALGEQRSKLFRSGKISMDKFTDTTGRTLSLAELDSMTL